MHPEGFVKQERGPYLVDRWQWPERVPTKLGDLVVELATRVGEPPPDVAMAAAASELAEFAATNGDLLRDLIYGHYRRAEENGWLGLWGVPAGLGRGQILSWVESVELAVRRDRRGRCDAGVHVSPHWDQEHQLDLAYRGGRIALANGEPFVLDDEVLRPA
jgi:hypothetical protein